MVQLDTNEIPQADLIWDVARVPEALARGMTTPSAIAAYLGGKVPRQGLYYAQAAHTLGLIERDAGGELALTTYGRAFMNYDRISKQRALRRLVIEREPMRSLVAGLHKSGGLNRDGLARLIQELAPLSESTARRRAQTIALWLCTLGLAKKEQGRLVYNGSAPLTGMDGQRQAA
jgi:hypothetical protein